MKLIMLAFFLIVAKHRAIYIVLLKIAKELFGGMSLNFEFVTYSKSDFRKIIE